MRPLRKNIPLLIISGALVISLTMGLRGTLALSRRRRSEKARAVAPCIPR